MVTIWRGKLGPSWEGPLHKLNMVKDWVISLSKIGQRLSSKWEEEDGVVEVVANKPKDNGGGDKHWWQWCRGGGGRRAE